MRNNKKKWRTIVFFVFIFQTLLHAQDITGQWNGVLTFQGNQLGVVLNVNKVDSGYISTLDSPDQGIKGIKVSKTSFENSILKIEILPFGIQYEGSLNQENQIIGEIKQSTNSSPLTWIKNVPEKPQDPVVPVSKK